MLMKRSGSGMDLLVVLSAFSQSRWWQWVAVVGELSLLGRGLHLFLFIFGRSACFGRTVRLGDAALDGESEGRRDVTVMSQSTESPQKKNKKIKK